MGSAAEVMTVLGPVAADELGVTLSHEHVFIDMSRVNRNIATRLDDVERMAYEVRRFGAAGGGTLVDVTPRNVGRRPASLVNVAERTGVNIVMGTAWYREPWYEPEVATLSVDACTELLISEIDDGTADDGVRPGILGEFGTDDCWISPIEERGFRAAARAHAARGLTITTHAFGCDIGLAQLDLLEEEGVPPGRVIVGHCDTWLVDEYIDAIIDRGAWVQLDTIRVVDEWDFGRRADLIERLLRDGRGDQLLLSQDICFRDQLSTNGGRGYTCLMDDFAPYLLGRGVLTSDDTERLIESNSQRALVDEPKPW
jgi:phosphotriesterase-related protein